MSRSSVEFASFLAYSVRGSEPDHEQSQSWMRWLKQERIAPRTSESTSRFIVRRLAARLQETPFADWFSAATVLVPVPSSRLLKQGSLWVPRRIADAMVAHGLGQRVETWLERTSAVPKSAWAKPEERPSHQRQYETLRMNVPVSPSMDVLVVDDVITRGATLLAASRRVQELLPGARVRGFAALRAISNPEEFACMFDPCLGRIEELPGGGTSRRP